MDIRRKIIKSFIGVGTMKLLSLPIGVMSSVILARTLGPEKFGQYAFIMALLPLIVLPVNGGLAQLLIREVATYVQSKSWSLYQGVVNAAHSWVVFFTIITLSGYFVLSEWLNLIPTHGKWLLLPVAIAIVPFKGLAAVRRGTIKGLGMPTYAELPSQLMHPVLVFILFFLLSGNDLLNVKAAMWVQLASEVLVFLLGSWMLLKIKPSNFKGIVATYNWSRWRKALLPFSMIALVSVFNTQVSIILLGLLSSDEQVAAMRIAERSGQFVIMSLTLVNMVISPLLVDAHRNKDRAILQDISRKAARVSFLLSLPIAFFLVVAGEPFIQVVFGADYSAISYWPVVILSVGQLVNAFFGSVGQILSMGGYERFSLLGQTVAVATNVFLCVFLVPKYGAIGSALAVAISTVVWNVILGFFVFRKVNITPTAF